MITYQYSYFRPEDEEPAGLDKLMSLVSEHVMKEDMSLEKALETLVEKGLPVELELQNKGLEDLLLEFRSRIESLQVKILGTINLEKVCQMKEEDYISLGNLAQSELLQERDLQLELKKALAERSQDAIRKFRWNFPKEDREFYYRIQAYLLRLIEVMEDIDAFKKAQEKYHFTGKEIPEHREAFTYLQELESLSELKMLIDDVIRTGEFQDFDFKSLAQFLGPESYMEFEERRNKIVESLKALLQKNGKLFLDKEGELRLSPDSIRKIGMKALSEVFSDLKPDNSSSNIYKGRIEGESENVDSISRVLEFGDNISNIDYSESIIESAIRGNGTRPALNDLRVYESRGALRSSTVILLDMSGSMARGMRFYNAKKVCMSLDSLIRSEYKDENLSIIGFGTTAKRISVSDLPILQPYSVNQLEPYIKLKFDLSNIVEKEIESFIPMYFTNLQKGLKLSRQILSSSQIKNKQIILITDGVPTAHCKGSCLYINYPPRKEDFDEALFELMQCTAENIVVNTFLLTNEWDVSYFGEESFIKKFAKISRGRIFYPHPNELNKIILFDFIRNRKKLISY